MIKYFKTSFSSILLTLQSLHPDLSVLFILPPLIYKLQEPQYFVYCYLLNSNQLELRVYCLHKPKYNLCKWPYLDGKDALYHAYNISVCY